MNPPYPQAELDFDVDGSYAVYNWELFFHLPLTVAIHLSRNQRYEEAQHWFHFVFDPTDDSDGPTPARFWRVKPFQTTDVARIEAMLISLSSEPNSALARQTHTSIDAWRKEPFSPHAVAATRPSAYMIATIMAYLDNLIAWGDSLFREDTGESINEATQLYVIAANILGPRPQPVPSRGTVAAKTYAQLKDSLDEFSNALVALEAEIPFDQVPRTAPTDGDGRAATLHSLGSLYFCVPPNTKLLGYWDTVADRLFKIRNSLNLEGVFRQLPLFEPPIDPALLAAAAAAGVNVGAVVSGVNQPLPLVRFGVLTAKASEICQEVKALGAGLLAATEKEDAEALALLRQRHESAVLDMTEAVRYRQWQEAIKAREGVARLLQNSIYRYTHYQVLLGKNQGEIRLPIQDKLDLAGLDSRRFEQTEDELDLPSFDISVVGGVEGSEGGRKLSQTEADELSHLEVAHRIGQWAQLDELHAGLLAAIPMFSVEVQPWGIGSTTQIGGTQLAAGPTAEAHILRGIADEFTHQAGRAAKLASYQRREQEWALQTGLAAGDQPDAHPAAGRATARGNRRERVAAQKRQIGQVQEMDRFLTNERVGKRTNKDFYTWLKRETRGLYSQCFQLAFDTARKAERALQYELGQSDRRFLQTGYVAGKERLLAGEKLALDVKRMELTYAELNRREYELTKHVSLRQIDPQALLQLRATGRCAFTLPEELSDLDCPGHYFRRIRTVAVSIPCVVGPYASVNATLTQQRSSLRRSAQLTGTTGRYTRDGDDVERFSDSYSSVQSIVTSSGQNDSGLFETNLRDERYLPFEGTGAISEWRLELPAAIAVDAAAPDGAVAPVPQFDPDTIVDVILHLWYTGREGGVPLREAALRHVSEASPRRLPPGRSCCCRPGTNSRPNGRDSSVWRQVLTASRRSRCRSATSTIRCGARRPGVK